MRDGGDFPQSRRLMAGEGQRRKGLTPISVPGHPQGGFPRGPTGSPGSITPGPPAGPWGEFHPSERSIFSPGEEKLRRSITFPIRTPAL